MDQVLPLIETKDPTELRKYRNSGYRHRIPRVSISHIDEWFLIFGSCIMHIPNSLDQLLLKHIPHTIVSLLTGNMIPYMIRAPDSSAHYQSGRSPKTVALFLLQTLVAISYEYFNCLIQSKRNHILVPNLVAFISLNDKNVWFFDHLLTCSVRKMVLICLMQNIDMCLLYKSHQIARLVSHLINHFSKWMFTV